ncbi:PREDICTED: disease resistance, partial [Prunus dulcis]
MAELAVPLAMLLVNNLIEKLNRPSPSKAKEDVERAQKMLRRMKAYLAEHPSDQIDEGPQVIRIRAKEIQDTVYDIEDALGKFVAEIPHHFHSNRFSRMTHDVKHFPSVLKASMKLSYKLKKIERRSTFDSLPALDSLLDPPIPNTRPEETYNNLVYHQVIEEEDTVGFEEPKEILIQQLVKGDNPSPLKISIVGPGGSGKTTLVNIVYGSRRVQGFFDCHAFVDVPRTSDCRKLLLSMLSKFEDRMQEPVGHRHHYEEIDPRDKLRKLLDQKRYVVVLDNVWSDHDLGCIVTALPKGLPGSKIIITARDSNLASLHANSAEYIHDLSRVLSWKDVTKLFCKKAFQGNKGECPEELQVCAEKILKRCEYLPLAVSAVATLLSKKPQTLFEWEKFHNSLVYNLPIIEQVWDPSYRDLPIDVQSCFLYFSMFPEDYSIKCERLIRLWVAEGFVTPRRGKTMEEVADGCLNELIGRNLVDVNSTEIDGKVRTCRVTSLVREFVISKAENFVNVVESNSTSTSHSGQKIRRLSAHYAPINNSSRGCRDLNRTSTLLVFGSSQPTVLSSQHDELGNVLKRLKYLRVLDFEGVPLKDFPKSILGLSLLKYISMRKTKIKSVPSSIKKLSQLETLDLKRTQVIELPKEIYELHNMRHLLVNRGCDQDDDGPAQGVDVVSSGNIGDLPKLQKLSLIKVGNNRTILKSLAELTGLRKLGLTDVKEEHGKELCCAVEKMVSLSTLEVRSTKEEENLDLDHIGSLPLSLQRICLKGRLERTPQWISQLYSVVKISLKESKLDAKANRLYALQALPNLMELNLVDYYTGEKLEFQVETFKKLKILRIQQLDQLNLMIVENGAMPVLKKLTMSKCKNLTLLPVGIEVLTKLEELCVHDMHTEFIAQLRRDTEPFQAVQHIPVIRSSTGIFPSLS